jgi:hypothetical protein
MKRGDKWCWGMVKEGGSFASTSHQDRVTPKGLSHMQKMNICNFQIS